MLSFDGGSKVGGFSNQYIQLGTENLIDFFIVFLLKRKQKSTTKDQGCYTNCAKNSAVHNKIAMIPKL